MQHYSGNIQDTVTTSLSEGAASSADGDKDEVGNDVKDNNTTEDTTNPDYVGDDPPPPPDDGIPF